MKKVTDRRKNIISHVKGTLDTMLRVEANSASCCVIYEPERPKDLYPQRHERSADRERCYT